MSEIYRIGIPKVPRSLSLGASMVPCRQRREKLSRKLIANSTKPPPGLVG